MKRLTLTLLTCFFSLSQRGLTDDATLPLTTANTLCAAPCPQTATASAVRHEVTEVRLTTDSEFPNPWDIDLKVVFEHSSGKSLTVPAFYDGRRTHVARFCPPVAGLWKWRSQSGNAALTDRTGQLDVGESDNPGGIVIDPAAPTRFRHKNGAACYPIAFECDWLFALDAENPSDIPRTRKFVNTLAASGFNQVVMNVFAYDVKWPKDAQLAERFDFGSPAVFPFGGSNDEPDFSRINVAYFQRLDRVIACLHEHGIAAHLMIYVWNKRVNWPAPGSDADNRYFDYVVKRYQAYPNLIWDISKEALGYGHTDVHYITDRIERLRKLDAYDRLITVHDYSYCRRFTDKVDFVSVQLWSSELFGVMRKVCQDMPGKPILNIEHGGYERGPYVVFTGNYTSPETCLARAWQCVFAGTYPTHYWQGAAWNVVIPDIEELPAEQRPRLSYYRHMQQFIERYNIDSLKAGDKKSNAGFCLHNGSDRFIYYVPAECEFIGLRLPKPLQGGTMTATWFNPYDGTYSRPSSKPIVQWPAWEVPAGDGFRLLVIDVQD